MLKTTTDMSFVRTIISIYVCSRYVSVFSFEIDTIKISVIHVAAAIMMKLSTNML